MNPLLDFLLRSSLLIGTAWLAAILADRAGGSAAMRHRIWLLALAALLALPVLALLLPPLPLEILPEAGPAPAGIAPVQTGSDGVSLFLIFYALAAAAIASRLVLGWGALHRLWRRADASVDPRWTRLFAELSAIVGVTKPVGLRLCAQSRMPMTWGTLRPKILLPADASDWDEDRRRIVLLHELAHVARRDAFTQAAAFLACAFYWFHPGAWLVLRRLRIEQEHACDEIVLAAGAPSRVYARGLLDLALAGSGPPFRLAASVAMARRSQLERRIVAIVGSAPRREAGTGLVVLGGGAALALTLFTATAMPVSAARQAAGMAPVAPVTAAVMVPASCDFAPTARAGR